MKKGKRGRTPQKRKNNSSTKCKKCSPMSLRDKEFVAVTILAVFVCMFLLTTINAPQNSVTITGHVVEGVEGISASQIGTFLTNIINPENADASVIKWVAFFSFALLIWGGISLVGIKNGFLRLLALPIAFAMVYLIQPEEIFAGIIGYSALGMTIIVLLPFIAIIFFSVRLLEKRLTAAKIILQLLVWYFYLAFMIYYLIRAFIATETYSLGVLLVIVGGIIVSILAIWKNKWLRNKIAEFNREGLGKEIEDIQHALGRREAGEVLRAKQFKEI